MSSPVLPMLEAEEWFVDDVLVGSGSPGGTAGDEVVEVEPPEDPGSPGKYAAELKKKLDLYCAAVARSRGYNLKPQDSSLANNSTQISDASNYDLHASANGNLPCSRPDLTIVQREAVRGGKQTISSSSKELSGDDEDDLEGYTETFDNANPADAKRMRRMLSNRESARRSRKRKQAHLNDLEQEAAQLRLENASLVKRLKDMTQKYNEACADNEVLRTDAEFMRAKMKLAGGTIQKRSNGATPVISSITHASTNGTVFSSGESSATCDAAVPMEADIIHFIAEPLHNEDQNPSYTPKRSTSASGKMNRPGLRRVASLERLQKRICEGAGNSGSSAREGRQ